MDEKKKRQMEAGRKAAETRKANRLARELAERVTLPVTNPERFTDYSGEPVLTNSGKRKLAELGTRPCEECGGSGDVYINGIPWPCEACNQTGVTISAQVEPVEAASEPDPDPEPEPDLAQDDRDAEPEEDPEPEPEHSEPVRVPSKRSRSMVYGERIELVSDPVRVRAVLERLATRART